MSGDVRSEARPENALLEVTHARVDAAPDKQSRWFGAMQSGFLPLTMTSGDYIFLVVQPGMLAES